MPYFISLLLLCLLVSCQNDAVDSASNPPAVQPEIAGSQNMDPDAAYPDETHFRYVKQITFGGDNAEAYFSFNDNYLVFQATNPQWDANCDQIYYMPTSGIKGRKPPLLSTGKGRTTCAFFMPGDTSIIYASTHAAADTCPAAPRMVNDKYVWPIYPEFDIFEANLRGKISRRLVNSPGYDAEASISPDGNLIVFTSIRSGDLELYTMNIDGSNIRQITTELGYDGGAFFSPDSKKLIFRASRPKTPEDVATYQNLLAQNLVQPTNMELFVCNVDGSELRQVTHLGGANWAPFFHPSGEKVIFSSNHKTASFPFNLFMINLDGSGLEQITYDKAFDSFPMFSPDGKRIVFSSNRDNGGTRETNMFVADWVE